LSPSSSLLLLAKTITHPAVRSLCDSWSSCYETQQNATNLNILVSRGSAATYFMCGGCCCNCFVGNLAGFLAVKELGKMENRLRFDEIIVTRGWRVFETQCRTQTSTVARGIMAQLLTHSVLYKSTASTHYLHLAHTTESYRIEFFPESNCIDVVFACLLGKRQRPCFASCRNV